MKEIKLLNGTGIEVTKDGVLLKGNSISFETDDVSVVVVRDGSKYSLSQSDENGFKSTIDTIDDEEDTDTKHVPTNRELEVWLRSIQSQVTCIADRITTLEIKASDDSKRKYMFPRFL
ncbi:hypothetical protein [Leuconostoc gasicomitatum]|uniref:hypothetical protein n=1 Tax=Leuconostoc gasicomitatum TaxID=115778 RepID=UPI001CC3A2C3|nr:hypothetical protein [Leuconostoc gasicomitatum]MBZ5958152.1 hypothetical protein [Leuconostoc gasicomitatum]